MPRRKVPTIKGGLVDYSCLRPYLHPDPYEVPFGILEDPNWENHHMYFPKEKYKQNAMTHEEREIRRSRLWSYPYSQVQLPSGLEGSFHDAHSMRVPFPRMRPIEAQLRDFYVFDLIGASALALNMSKDPDRPHKVSPTAYNGANTWPPEMTSKERMNFFRNERTNAVARLKDIEVTPKLLIASIIKRLAVNLDDPFLTRIARQFLGRDRQFYPVQIPPQGHLYELARDRLIYDYRLNTSLNFRRNFFLPSNTKS